jgi:leader peptidase (prepilin peptidase)/N-methyltransferase
MPISIIASLAGLSGAMFGSFFNVVAHRLPRGESLSHPRSRCPGCGTPIRSLDNVPVLSWLLLRGRCRACGIRISPRYPIVEATTAALAVAIVVGRHTTAGRALGLVLLAALVPAALIDLDTRKIPNKITYPASVAAVVIGLALNPSGVPTQLAAGAAAFAFLLVFALAYPGGLGMGDVKLAGVMGLFLGKSVGVALFVALIAGAGFGVAIMARHGVRRGRKMGIPFGPFLALGGVLAAICGPQILHWYLNGGLAF